ncbi:GH36-type glycosyl hydrolase domain-containing protein [Tessaracoccus terricola]
MSPLPIRAEFTSSGALARLFAGDLSLLQYPASELEPGPHQVWLRRRSPTGHEAIPLLGPSSAGRVVATRGEEVRVETASSVGRVAATRDEEVRVETTRGASLEGPVITGTRWNIGWQLRWQQPGDGRFGWELKLTNTGDDPVELDAVWTVDAALTEWDALRRNEFYVSQYLDLTPIRDGEDLRLAVRQNMPGVVNPWLALGATRPVVGWCTDALQLRPSVPGTGLDLTSDLPSQRLQHEHTLAGLQAEAWMLAPGEEGVVGFRGIVEADHPSASSDDDAARLRDAFIDGWNSSVGGDGTRGVAADTSRTSLAPGVGVGDEGPAATGQPAVPTVFGPAHFVHGDALPEDELLALLPSPEQVERGPDADVWSFRADGTHVVAAAKEAAVLRPHGHVIRVSEGPFPQDHTVAVTAWMNGNFASQLTAGHASAHPLLSVRRSYLGLTQADGVRILVRTPTPSVEQPRRGTSQGVVETIATSQPNPSARRAAPSQPRDWRLLGVPSAWAVDQTSATWWYRTDGRTIRATTSLALAELKLEVTVDGDPLDLLVVTTGEQGFGGDSAPLFADGVTRDGDWRAEVVPSASSLVRAIPLERTAPETEPSAPRSGRPEVRGADSTGDGAVRSTDDASATTRRLAALLPWLEHDAYVHYLAPRGLEQFTGGAWGTRDVCQGPIGLLVATGRLDVVRQVLLEVFAAQQDDGDWPQWFDYLKAHRAPGHRESHGDIVYWPLLALGEYLQATGDLTILDEEVGWVGAEELLPGTAVRAHVVAAVDHLLGARSADPRLPAYGHGDWNDSLQPASPELAAQLVSTWTAGLEIKALEELAIGLGDAEPEQVERLRGIARATSEAVHDSLLVDGELCGYAVVTPDGVEPLVHPHDGRTGLHHGSLQMIHAIADEQLTPEEAAAHVRVIDEHLDGPVGIYLFDRPVDYHGGETHTFLRAEAASFWGREVGLMYTHAHLRWIEALLRLGEADRAWRTLDVVLPDGLTAHVPGARPRQSNCYFSSVDTAFRDRADAEANAESMFDPEFGFEGGWRVYSSGPGLVLRLVTEGFLGMRGTRDGVVMDPVLPAGALEATVYLDGVRVDVRYDVTAPGHGVTAIEADGVPVPTEPAPRRYRPGGVRIPATAWQDLVCDGEVTLRVRVGGSQIP